MTEFDFMKKEHGDFRGKNGGKPRTERKKEVLSTVTQKNMMKTKILYTGCLFFVEMLVQIVYYSLSIKYLDGFYAHERLGDIFFDTLYAVGLVKVIFFLPVYLVFYSVTGNRAESNVKAGIVQMLLFVAIFFILSWLLPGDIIKRIYDTISLSLIAFSTAYLMHRKNVVGFSIKQHPGKTNKMDIKRLH